MTGKLGGWRRGLLSGTAGVAVVAGMAFGTAGLTHADPAPEPAPTPTTTTSPVPVAAPAAGPVTVPSAVGTSAPKPTVAVEGGAAAAGTAATGAATGASTGDVLDQLADEYATEEIDLGPCRCPGTVHGHDSAVIRAEVGDGEFRSALASGRLLRFPVVRQLERAHGAAPASSRTR